MTREAAASSDAADLAGAEEVDVVVLGAGPVGENVAQCATGDSGLTCALVEAELVGGECSYYACMPSKALLRPLDVATTAEQLGGLRRPEVDVAGVLARRDYWVSGYDDSGQVAWAESAGLQVIRGHGRIVAERLVEVGDTRLRARHAVVIATGSVPVIPPIYAGVAPWTSRDATGVVEIPERLVVIGGGVVACEAATWMAGLGSAVTLIVRGRLLAGQEPFVGEAVLAGLRRLGVTVHLETDVVACRREAPRETGLGRIHGGPVTLELSARKRPGGSSPEGSADGSGHDAVEEPDREVVADEILVAVGRRPRLADVGLDTVGLDADDVLVGRLPDWLWAVGDASGEAALTHWGKYRARVVGEQIASRALGRPAAESVDAPVPQVVFTDPQVAAVGLTEAAARRAGHDVVVAQVPFASAAGSALLRDEVPGTAQLVVDRSSGAVLGATFVGPDAGELLHAATIAILTAAPVRLLRHAVPSYPTVSELWLRLLESLPRDLR